MVSRLATMTPAERAENLEKARVAQRAKQAARKAAPFVTEWLDRNYQERLASKMGVRLPPIGEAPTPSAMRKLLTRVNRSGSWYAGQSGERTLTEFGKSNPTWSARQWAGVVLEWVAKEQGITLDEQEITP